MKPVKVLFVHGGILNRAGTETFLVNALRMIDSDRVHIDFVVFGRSPGDFDQEVLSHGSKIYRVPYTFADLKIGGPSLRTIKKQIKHEHYDIVHAHMNALNGIVLRVMKKLGISIRISHSHASENIVDSALISKFMDYTKRSIPKYATQCLACSEIAGEFLYGETPFSVIKNGIDVLRFDYNPELRTATRNAYNLNDKFVVGHIGRFHFQKNHEFLIDVFYELHKKKDNAHLVLVGGGGLEDKIRNKIHSYGLDAAVTFTGILESTDAMLQAFDVFVLPSRFEGLPYVLVEAQCSGCPCVVADTVSQESKLIDDFSFLPLEDPDKWADEILKYEGLDRKSGAKALRLQGYDNQENGKWLMEYYCSCVNDTEN